MDGKELGVLAAGIGPFTCKGQGGCYTARCCRSCSSRRRPCFSSPPPLCPPQAKQSLATLTKDVPKRHSLAMPGETVLNGNQEWVLQADLPLTAAIRQSQQTLYHSHPQHSADRQGETPRPGHSNPGGFWGEICSRSSLVSPARPWLPWLGWKSARQMSIGSRIQSLAQWAWLAFGFCTGLGFAQL